MTCQPSKQRVNRSASSVRIARQWRRVRPVRECNCRLWSEAEIIQFSEKAHLTSRELARLLDRSYWSVV